MCSPKHKSYIPLGIGGFNINFLGGPQILLAPVLFDSEFYQEFKSKNRFDFR